ncbi:hypothetical protein [Sphingomonas sp.]|uniref:hypothetical protein n=1 Tax=Sphingomonas sp. TaxID=28214 RepID=UPI0035BC46A3
MEAGDRFRLTGDVERAELRAEREVAFVDAIMRVGEVRTEHRDRETILRREDREAAGKQRTTALYRRRAAVDQRIDVLAADSGQVAAQAEAIARREAVAELDAVAGRPFLRIGQPRADQVLRPREPRQRRRIAIVGEFGVVIRKSGFNLNQSAEIAANCRSTPGLRIDPTLRIT